MSKILEITKNKITSLQDLQNNENSNKTENLDLSVECAKVYQTPASE